MSYAGRWVFLCLCIITWTYSTVSKAEDAQAPRRIAPQSFPEYRGRASTEQESRIQLPTADKPLGACDENLPRNTWLRCLRQTIDAADAAIETLVENARQRVAERADVSLGQRQFWVRTLGEAQAAWKAHRNAECQFLAVFENPGPRSADERLLCQLRLNRLRMADLEARYGRR